MAQVGHRPKRPPDLPKEALPFPKETAKEGNQPEKPKEKDADAGQEKEQIVIDDIKEYFSLRFR